jgi:hypothetical protein
VDGSGSGSCSNGGFGVRVILPSGSATIVNLLNVH